MHGEVFIGYCFSTLEPFFKTLQIFCSKTQLPQKLLGSRRKAWLLNTIFAIHSPFLLPSFFRGKKKSRDQKSCLSARSLLGSTNIRLVNSLPISLYFFYHWLLYNNWSIMIVEYLCFFSLIHFLLLSLLFLFKNALKID